MITKEQAKALFDTLDDIGTPMMQGDNLAILFCSYFDDGEVNPDSDTGWSEMAENGYSEVIGAIKSHFIPVHQAFIALHERVERLTEALVDQNDLLRSAMQIAKREGVEGEIGSTNWDAYYNRVVVSLKRHHDTVNEARAILKETTND